MTVLELTLCAFSCSFLIIIFVCYLFFLPFVVNKDFHCTRFAGITSSVAVIHACIIQGSALGPASYVVTAADLHPPSVNRIFKFTGDTCILLRLELA